MTLDSRRFAYLLGSFGVLVVAAFALGLFYGTHAHADEPKATSKSRTVYPKRTDLDFEGMAIEGEVKNPGEFYFQHRGEEKFDSLVQRRKNFHRQMLRDAVLSK